MPGAGRSLRTIEQGDCCIVLLQRCGEVACPCPACLPPLRHAGLLGEEAAGCGPWGEMVAGQRGSSGLLHQPWQAEEQRERCQTSCFPRLHAHFQGGGGRRKWWFMFKNMSVPRAPCDSFNAFFSKAVSLAPGCFQPHSLLWDLSLLGPWLQQRLYCIFIRQVPFWF